MMRSMPIMSMLPGVDVPEAAQRRLAGGQAGLDGVRKLDRIAGP
jgi:hypothetical protein